MTTTRTRITTEIQVPGTDIWFEAIGHVPNSYDDVWTSETPTGYVLTFLVQDECYGEDFEWDNPDTPNDEWVNGCFRDFRDSRDGGGQEARDTFATEMIEEVGVYRVFIVDVYSHGMDHFSIANTAPYPDRQWDVAPACVLAVPADVTNPREWAEGVLETYSSWVNGDVWGIVTYDVAPDGTLNDYDTIHGYIGHENAEAEAKAIVS